MDENLCIAKAYDDRPLCRAVVGVTKQVVYLLDPSRLSASALHRKAGVGFPHNCVFEFENPLFSKLLDAYDSGDRARLGELWGQLHPLDISSRTVQKT